MSNLKWAAALLAAFSLCACGGSGGLDAGSTGSVTSLSGTVKTAATQAGLSGVRISAPATGRTTTSGGDGRFELGDVPAESVQIVITVGDLTTTITVDVTGGGHAELDVEISDNGVVVTIHVDRCDGDDSETEARSRLTAVEEGLEGHVEVEAEADGDQKFEVEVEGLEAGQTISVDVINGDGLKQTVGTATANERGRAEVELETSDGENLPFEAESVLELAGFGVVVRDGDTVLMEGTVPDLESEPTPCEEHDEDDDSDESDDDDSDDDESDDDDSDDDEDNDSDEE